MAALTSEQILMEFTEGDAAPLSMFALKNVNAGDTANLSQWYSTVKWATMGAITGTASPASCSVTGTTVTVPSGYSADAAGLMAYGPAA